MRTNSDYEWRKYKNDFLLANHCTDEQFEAAYVVFMGSHKNKPSIKDYRQFARKYRITIFPDPNLPEDLRTVLSISIAVIKVMAKSSLEAENAVKDILAIRH